MQAITLPDELNVDADLSIVVYDYTSNQEISRQQIVLNKNIFSFLIKGTKEVFFDTSSSSIGNDQFLLMTSGHCLMTEKLSHDAEYRSILFFFTNEDVLRFIAKFNLENSHSIKPKSVYSFDYNDFIKRFVDSIIDLSKMSKSIQKNILTIKFEEILLYLIENNGSDFLFSLMSNRENHKFIQTIERYQLKKMTLKELAFLSNMSLSTFKREFEKHYDQSPIKWFQEKRLEHAAFLLKDKSKRPSDIFEDVGYESLSNFIQAFKLKFGVTPKQYQSI